MKATRRSRYEEKTLGDFAFHPHGDHVIPMIVPVPAPVSGDARVEIEVGGEIWTVPAKNVLAAARAADDVAAVEALGGLRAV